MKKVTAAIWLLSLLAGSAQACGPHRDDWFGEDKAKHFGVSFAVGVATSRVTSDEWSAFGLALLPGLAKELYDSGQDCNRFSWKDMGWNAAGAYVGVRTGNWIFSPSGVAYRASF